MPFDFDYEKHRQTRNAKPMASIHTTGRLCFNVATKHKYCSSKQSFATLGFDKETKHIAVRFVDSRDVPGAINVFYSNSTVSMAATYFLRYWRIPFRDSLQNYDISQDDDGMLILARRMKENE